MQDRDHLYIGGEWVASTGTNRIEVEEPATEQVLATIPEGTPADVDAAVAAARKAFDAWSRSSREERSAILRRIRDGLAERQDRIAETITREVGTPIRISKAVQATLPLTVLDTYIAMLDGDVEDERIGTSLVVRDPVGVVGAITPWNYPLHQVVAKVAPALAAGCTVVLKPSEVAPLAAYELFDVIHEAGLPPGLVNLVPGYGVGVGEAIAGHPGIDAVTFTGSVGAGARVAQLGATNITRVTLELGGKSANVVLPDADLQTAVKAGINDAFLNGGQTCTALTRLLVPAARQDEALDLAAERAVGFAPGDPLEASTKLGPMSSGRQLDRVRGYITTGAQDGARLVAGGADRPADLERGHYVSATVFGDVDPSSTIAQEEIFGPVLSVIPYRDEAHALEIANDSMYGLSGAVWSGDQDHAIAFGRRMRTGQVAINGGPFDPLAPFGGFKHSGIGRELGPHGLEEFLEIKALRLPPG